MPFIDKIIGVKSLSIVGTAKNTGKTETLNFILRSLTREYPQTIVGITSIGLEGEKRDQVTQTEKPEIVLSPNTIFVTAESFYHKKEISAEVVEIERKYTTSTGKLVYGRAKAWGKVLIAGPSSTQGLRKVTDKMTDLGANLTIIDGAFSRLSLASPGVADGLVLATGAALSAQPEVLIKKTRHLVDTINLPELPNSTLADTLDTMGSGIRIVLDDNQIVDTGYASALLPDLWLESRWLELSGLLFIPGAVHDKLIDRVRQSKSFKGIIVRDFTRLFISDNCLRSFRASGKEIYCLNKAKLLAVTFNPQSPSGYRMNSLEITKRLSDSLGLPVYDVKS